MFSVFLFFHHDFWIDIYFMWGSCFRHILKSHNYFLVWIWFVIKQGFGYNMYYEPRKLYCLFVCLGIIVPLENLSLIQRRHHCWWKAANFDLYSVAMDIEQWGFFSVPHLLWHGLSVYNGHFRWPVTLTPIAERLFSNEAVISYFKDLGLSRLGFEHPTFRLQGECSGPLRHCCGLKIITWYKILQKLNKFGEHCTVIAYIELTRMHTCTSFPKTQKCLG